MLVASGATAQNSLPAPGSGGSYTPNVGGGWGPGMGCMGPSWSPGYYNPGAWGSPWYDGYGNYGYNFSPTIVVQPSTQNFENQGTEKVIACGYDAEGVWRVLPMYVSYTYNGVQYDVNVLNTWNPWTDKWDDNVDEQAYNCNHKLRGVTYKFYTNLPTGTFYFNL